MKQIILTSIITIILFSRCNEIHNGYTINGKIDDVSKQIKIYLKNDHTGIVEDSTIANNGNFQFNGITEYPQRYSLIYVSTEGKQNHYVWLENTAIEIAGKLSDIENIKIKAGKEQKLVKEIEKVSSFFYPEYNRLIKEKKNDSISLLIKRLSKVTLNFCIKNANSYMAIEMLYRYRNKIKKDSLRLVLEKVDSNILNSKYGKSLSFYSKSPDLEVGMQYIDFTAKTLSGETISISEQLKRGKPILIVFGGLECMQEHGRKILKDFHDNYKNDIKIFAFVFAKNKEEWIHDSNYPLDIPLLSDMKGDHSLIKIQYDVQATPTVFLINREGLITFKSIGYGNNVNNATKKLI